jgi:TolA-binding protein
MRAVVAGMAAGGAVVTTAGSASAASGAVPAAKASVLLLAGKWLAVGAGAGLLVTGSLVGPLHHLMEPASADSRDSTAHVPVVPGRASPASEAQVTGPNGEQAATPVVDAPGEAPPAKPANPSKAPDAQRARPAPLAAEVAAIDLAARAVAERDPARGLVALDAYEKAFPGGVLRPEATVLRVQALVQQGDRPRAVAIARVFLAQHPHSPHADRLRSLVGVD